MDDPYKPKSIFSPCLKPVRKPELWHETLARAVEKPTTLPLLSSWPSLIKKRMYFLY